MSIFLQHSDGSRLKVCRKRRNAGQGTRPFHSHGIYRARMCHLCAQTDNGFSPMLFHFLDLEDF